VYLVTAVLPAPRLSTVPGRQVPGGPGRDLRGVGHDLGGEFPHRHVAALGRPGSMPLVQPETRQYITPPGRFVIQPAVRRRIRW